MKKIALILSLFSVILTSKVYAQPESPQPFENAQDSQNTTNSPFSQQSFVPDISLIVDSAYVYRNIANETFSSLKIPGFTNGIEEFGINGFNLNYAELSFASTEDPYFDLLAVIPVTP